MHTWQMGRQGFSEAVTAAKAVLPVRPRNKDENSCLLSAQCVFNPTQILKGREKL